MMEYLDRFNQLSQYASEYVRTDLEKEHCFVQGLHTKLQDMLAGHFTVSYDKIVSIAISNDEVNYRHKEAKKRKNVLEESFGSNVQC